MRVLAAIIHIALPPLSILAMGRRASSRGVVWMVVSGLALYASSLLVSGLLLGHVGLLRAPAPLIFWSIVAALLAIPAMRGVGYARAALCNSLGGERLRPADAAIGAAILGTAYLVCLQVARDWIIGTANFDSLSYHIPRALVWTWQGGLRPWPTAVWQQVGLPVGGDLLLLPDVLLGIGWLGSSWTTTWLSLGAAAAVFAIARDSGAGRRASLLAALVFLSFPAVGGRCQDVNSDIAAAFPLLAAWVLCTRARSMAEAAFLFPALCGVGVATKGNVAPAVLVLAIGFFSSRLSEVVRSRRALAGGAAGVVAAALLCFGSYQPVYSQFGDLLGGNEGRILVSFQESGVGLARAGLFGVLHWVVEPFALVPDPLRFDLLDDLGVGRAYAALGAGSSEDWYPELDSATNRTGVFPLLALPWLFAALPRGKRLRGVVIFLALLLALVAPVNPNHFASRFVVVVMAGFAVLWGLRAARSLGLVTALLLASLVADARLLQWQVLPEAAYGRARDRSNSRLVGAVRSGTLWLLTGSLSNDAELAGRRANLRFRYLSCPPDRDWVRRFAQIRETSPWLLLNVNVNPLNTGPAYYSRLGPPCPAMLVGDLQRALTAAGWHLAFEENGYQVWSGEPARRPEEPKEGGARAHPRPDAELSRDG